MAESCAGVNDCWASGHGLRPFLWLKSLRENKRKEKDSNQSGGRCVCCINHPHSPSCYLLVCTNDHLVLFNSDLKQTDMSDVYTFLMVLRDMIRQGMCLRSSTGGGGRSPGRLAGCPARGSPRCLLLRCWNTHRARDSARVPLTKHLERHKTV